MIECLVSADLSVENPDAVAELFVATLGLPQWRPNWVHDWAARGYRAYFLRPQANRAVAPTAIEVIGPHPEGGWNLNLRSVHKMQGDRPMRTHNTVFSVPDPEDYVRRLRDASIPFRYDPGSGELAFGKLWIGQTMDGDSFEYDPVFDAGLFIEIVPTSSMRLPEAAEDPPTTYDVDAGAVVRAASRSFIVDDIDQTLRTVEASLGWQASDVRQSAVDRSVVATYRPRLPGSAVFELLQPNGEGPVADHRAAYGTGAYRITFAVNGLEAAAARLDDRGATYTLEQPQGGDDARLRIDPASFAGLSIDLVDA